MKVGEADSSGKSCHYFVLVLRNSRTSNVTDVFSR